MTPRAASTVVLLRPDDEGGFELLLTRRPEQMRFLGGYYVFPGGTVHHDDYSSNALARCRALTGESAQRILGSRHEPDEALGHWVAVIRELFEEVGILLCTDEAGDAIKLDEPEVKQRIEQQRQAIVRKKLQFSEFLEIEDLYCDLARVSYFDHWVTPAIYSMRFDTRFFAAQAPTNQTPLERSEEVTHSLWINPAEAMARLDRYEFPILPPTTTVIGELSRIGTWARLCERFDFDATSSE